MSSITTHKMDLKCWFYSSFNGRRNEMWHERLRLKWTWSQHYICPWLALWLLPHLPCIHSPPFCGLFWCWSESMYSLHYFLWLHCCTVIRLDVHTFGIMTAALLRLGSVIVWELLAQERPVIGRMWGYQQVVMCTHYGVMWYVS